jgi:hypothetical protein
MDSTARANERGRAWAEAGWRVPAEDPGIRRGDYRGFT